MSLSHCSLLVFGGEAGYVAAAPETLGVQEGCEPMVTLPGDPCGKPVMLATPIPDADIEHRADEIYPEGNVSRG